jgi:hypothetical protein
VHDYGYCEDNSAADDATDKDASGKRDAIAAFNYVLIVFHWFIG